MFILLHNIKLTLPNLNFKLYPNLFWKFDTNDCLHCLSLPPPGLFQVLLSTPMPLCCGHKQGMSSLLSVLMNTRTTYNSVFSISLVCHNPGVITGIILDLGMSRGTPLKVKGFWRVWTILLMVGLIYQQIQSYNERKCIFQCPQYGPERV